MATPKQLLQDWLTRACRDLPISQAGVALLDLELAELERRCQLLRMRRMQHRSGVAKERQLDQAKEAQVA